MYFKGTLIKLIEEQNMTATELSLALGKNKYYVGSVLYKRLKPRTETIEKIAYHLDLNEIQFKRLFMSVVLDFIDNHKFEDTYFESWKFDIIKDLKELIK